jgi:hypothetical protein
MATGLTNCMYSVGGHCGFFLFALVHMDRFRADETPGTRAGATVRPRQSVIGY